VVIGPSREMTSQSIALPTELSQREREVIEQLPRN
jgi:hypothetical protein